ncbi:head-tail connector protein [Sphingomonas humi]|uniref:Phage gp6-like head-tail connector protein n=1 Tax=Sphingomonas humi TaxID=335630 RepID=A0ABP7S130_9SPHN
MVRQDQATLCVSLSEVQAYARVETGEEEALLAGLLRTASEWCETFLNQALVARDFELDLRSGESWTMLPLQPVRSINSVRRKGDADPLAASAYRSDIDFDGRGHIAGLPAGDTFVVSGSAGMGLTGNEIPEPIRQGILRLAAYLFANRDSLVGELPKAVTALWRPYRKTGLCR